MKICVCSSAVDFGQALHNWGTVTRARAGEYFTITNNWKSSIPTHMSVNEYIAVFK